MNNVMPINVDGLPGLIGRAGQRLYAMRERADKAICLLDARMRTLTAEPEEGAATAEYAVVLVAATGFAAVLVGIMKSDAIKTLLAMPMMPMRERPPRSSRWCSPVWRRWRFWCCA